MFALAMQGWRGAQPPSSLTMSSWRRARRHIRPKDLVTRKLFFARRGAGEVVCTAPKNLIYMKTENHCVVSKLHSDFVYVYFHMCEQSCMTLVLRLFTSNSTVQAPRRACKWARHEILRAYMPAGTPSGWHRPFLKRGCAPFTPACKSEHRTPLCARNFANFSWTFRKKINFFGEMTKNFRNTPWQKGVINIIIYDVIVCERSWQHSES